MSIRMSFVSQSGNVGKSTLAVSMAIEAMNNRLTVAIVDLDHEHRTAAQARQEREELGIKPLFDVYEATTAREAVDCFHDEKLQIIDCPSRATEATIYVAKTSDLIVQPTTCAKKDLNNAINLFYQLADNGVSADKMLFVLTRVGSEAELKKAHHYLNQIDIDGEPIAVITSPLWEKIGYRNAINDGFGITETQYQGLNDSARSVIHQILSSTI